MVFVLKAFPDEEGLKAEGKQQIGLTKVGNMANVMEKNCCKPRKSNMKCLKGPGLLL